MPDIYLYSGATNPNDIILRDPTTLARGTVGGIRRIKLDQPRGFSRKYFEELLAAKRAAEAAEEASFERKREEQRAALERAAEAAQEAIAVAAEPDYEADLARMTRALNAAVSAKNFSVSLKRAADAVREAQILIATQRLAAEADEEEEAIMLLMLQ